MKEVKDVKEVKEVKEVTLSRYGRNAREEFCLVREAYGVVPATQ